MVARQLRRIELRKSVLVARSQGLRQEFATEIAPIKRWMNKAELGFRLARQGRDLLFILAPILFATVKGEGGMMKRAMAFLPNWRVLQGVWECFRSMRPSAP
jgi:hypothetical protein